ncbi:MAG: acetoin utilization protein AcuC [archaeon]|nr:acetoin utilization protein AcuC [archaeon]MCP8314827.1 acetoin utilization protein AcuC [archaeon]
MCSIGVIFGEEFKKYSFPDYPLASERVEAFWQILEKEGITKKGSIKIIEPVLASEEALLLFHTKGHVDFVKRASEQGSGYLDYGNTPTCFGWAYGETPAFKGIFEAASYLVGSTLLGLDMLMKKEFDHIFNPIGGMHHARRSRSAGLCVFNDAAIAIIHAKKTYGLKRIFYVDIDAHHGNGVFYDLNDDPAVYIADIHEDGRYLYPGTGSSSETGSGEAVGTKMNLPLAPKSEDKEFKEAFAKVEEFAYQVKPELIIFQCGADGLKGDPYTHLHYTEEAHRYATNRLHRISHELCEGRILALGGGGYNPNNVAKAWLEVVKALVD